MLFSLSISLRSHTFRLRSYTFCRGFRNDLLIFHTFLYVLSNPYAVSEKQVLRSYVPIRSVQPYPKFGKICTQIIRSYTFWATLSQNLKKHIVFHTFLQVPCNSIAKSYSRWKTKVPCATVSQINAGGLKAHTHIGMTHVLAWECFWLLGHVHSDDSASTVRVQHFQNMQVIEPFDNQCSLHVLPTMSPTSGRGLTRETGPTPISGML